MSGSYTTRPLSDATIPLEGPISISQPVVLVAQQANAIYILCLVEYDDGDELNVKELIFSSYFSGSYNEPNGSGNVNNLDNLLYGVDYSWPTYTQSPINSLFTPDCFYYYDQYLKYALISKINVAVLKYNPDNSFTVLDQDGQILGKSQTIMTPYTIGAFNIKSQYSIVSTTAATQYNVSVNNSSFAYPNLYAGESYGITLNGVSPFRFIDILIGGPENHLNTPSSCANFYDSNPSPIKEFLYQCNQYSEVSNFDLLRYTNFITEGIYNMATVNNDYANSLDPRDIQSPQSLPTEYNFFPTVFYQANVSFAESGYMNPTSDVCVSTPSPNYDPTSFMTKSFYFWASDFEAYFNSGTDQISITTQGTLGFTQRGLNEIVNTTGWVDTPDCQRSYFYNFCVPGSDNVFCGNCMGNCASGQPCDINSFYTPTPPIGAKPFVCATSPIPPGPDPPGPNPPNPNPPNPNPNSTFWEKYKKDIIIIVVITVIVAIIFLIVILASAKKKKNNLVGKDTF